MNDPAEEWRQVPDWPYYQVSDVGRVRSINRTITDSLGKERRIKGRLLIPQLRPDGHVDVGLMANGDRRMVRVHTLVLEAFRGPRPGGLQACHFNDVGTDNRLANLRWGTRSDNMQDMVRNGNHFQAKKTHCTRGHALLHPNLVPAMLELGRRQCRSCAAARAMANDQKGAISPVDVQAVADKYYERWGPVGDAA